MSGVLLEQGFQGKNFLRFCQTLAAAAALPRAQLLNKLVAELVPGFARILQSCRIHESQGCEGLHPDFQKKFFCYICVWVCVPHVCMCLKRPEGGTRHPGAGVLSGCKP